MKLREIFRRGNRSRMRARNRSRLRNGLFESLENRHLLAADQIVFVDPSVWEQNTVPPDLMATADEVVVLSEESDGLVQIADYLDGRANIAAINILSHGETAEISPLGNAVIKLEDLGGYASELATIGAAMHVDGDILLWGCAVADTIGEDFVRHLANATGADVAASNDSTGSPSLGGDWELEFSTGPIEATNLLEAIDPQIILSHFRGGSVTHTVDTNGVVNLEVYTLWRDNSVNQPFFSLWSGPSRTGTNYGNFTVDSHDPNFDTGTELGGTVFDVALTTASFDLDASGLGSGTYYATWQSNARVAGINNASQSRWELETKIVWDGMNASASPTLLPATIDIVAKGQAYTQFLNSSDPDGTPLSYEFLVGSSDPNYGPNSQIPGINLDSLGGVNISAANTTAMNQGRWVYKVRVTDGNGAYSERDVMVVAEPTSGSDPNLNPPVLSSIGSKVVPVGTNLSFNVSGTDPDNEEVTVRSQLLPQGASFPDAVGNGSASSTFSWTPTPGQEGVYLVNFETYESGESVPIIDNELVQITVTGANDPPVLNVIGNQSVANGGTINFTVGGSDPDGDNLTYSAFFLPTGATFNPTTREFSWTPTPSQYNNTFTGITFRVTDDGVPNLFDEEPINITAGAGNVAPVFDPISDFTAQVGQPISLPVQVTDALGQTIDLTSLALPPGASFSPTSGTSPVSSTFTWTPTITDVGLNTVRLRAEDNGNPILSTTDEFIITVVANQPPVAQGDEYHVLEAQAFTTTVANGVLANDTDPESDSLAASLVSGPSFDSGSFSLNPNGTFAYTHNGSENFTDTFVYEVDDGEGNTAQATVTIHITPVNEAPSFDLNGSDGAGNDFSTTFTEDGGAVSIVDVDLEVADPDAVAPGSIYVADSLGDLIRIDPATGAQAIVSEGGNFDAIQGLAIDSDGSLLTFDHDYFEIVRIDPLTGTQTLVSDTSIAGNAGLDGGHALVVEADGNILVGRHTGISRVDPNTGVATSISSTIPHVHGLALEANGDILAASMNGSVTRIDPVTLATTTLASGLNNLWGITVDDSGQIFVLDSVAGAIIQIDPNTFAQSIFASGGLLNAGILGLTRDWNGDFLVSDDTDNEIIRVDAITAAQSVVSNGGKLQAPFQLATTSNLVLQSATATITNVLDGLDESLAVSTTGTPITASYDPGTGVLSLSGAGTLADYQVVLQTLAYNNVSQNPNEAARLVEVVVNDGFLESPIATATVSVVGTNDAPTADDEIAGEVSVGEDDSATDITAILLAGDSDLDGDPLSITKITDGSTTVTTTAPGSITLSSGAIVSLDASGNVSFDPNGQFESLAVGETNTSSNFSYSISDGNGGSDSGLVTAAITGANDAPLISVSGGGNGDGLVYRGSFDGTTARPFEVYDVANDSWTQLTSIETATTFGTNSAGELFKLTTATNTIDVYDPDSDTWSPVIAGPTTTVHGFGNLEVTDDNEFIVIWPERTAGSAEGKVVHYTVGGVWQSLTLPNSADTAADFDPSTNTLAVRRYRLHESYLVDLTTATITTYSAGSGASIGTTARFGEIYGGQFYSQSGLTPVFSYDLSNPGQAFQESSVSPNTLSPSQSFFGGTLDDENGEFYLSGFNRTDFFRWDPVSDSYTVLASASISNGHHTMAFVGGGDSDGGQLSETNSGLSVSSTLTLSDADVSDSVTASVTAVTESGSTSGLSNGDLLGMIDLGANPVVPAGSTSGVINWTFDSGSEAFDYLANGESLVLTYIVTATDSTGESDTHEITITINGTNDAPTAVDDTHAIVEQLGDESGNTVSGNLITGIGSPNSTPDSDPDATDVLSVEASDVTTFVGVYGNLTVTNADGSYSYDLGATPAQNSLLNSVNSGDTVFDTFTDLDIIDGNGGGDQSALTITITGTTDNMPPEIVGGDTASYAISENNTSIIVDVETNDDLSSEGGGLVYSLDGGEDAALFSINSSTGELSFTSGADFEGASFDGDDLYEVTVRVTDGGPGTPLSDSQDITVEVTDLQTTVSIADLTSILEGSVASFTVSATGDNINTPFDILFSTADGAAEDAGGGIGSNDYDGVSSGTISFLGNAVSESQHISISVNDDDVVEFDETFFVNLLSATSNDVSFDTIAGTSAVDQETPGPYNVGFGAASANTWQQEVVVGAAGQLVGIDLYANNPGEFNVAIYAGPAWQSDAPEFSTTLVSGLGQVYIDTASAGITLDVGDVFVIAVNGVGSGVGITGSTSNNPSGQYPGRLFLNGSEFADGSYDLRFRSHMAAFIADQSATGTILNDDLASLTIDDASVVEGDLPGVSEVTLTVSIDPGGSGIVSQEEIAVTANSLAGTATGGNVDFDDVLNQTLTIAAGTTSTTLTVPITRENLAEADENFEIMLSDPLFSGSSDPTRVVIGRGTGTGTIVNDDYVPVADAGGPYEIDEGDELTLSASASTDIDDGFSGLTFRWDVDGNGDFAENVVTATPTLSWTQLNALGSPINDGPDGPRTIRVEVSDGTNIDVAETTLIVRNVAPTLVLDSVADIDENGVATLTGTISDPGTLDTFTLDIDWGDSLSPDNVEQYTFAASTTGSQTFTLYHQYLDDNPSATSSDTYTISVTVTDADGGVSGAPIPFSQAGPEFQVNTTTTDRQTISAGQAGGRAVATDPFGNFVIVWSSNHRDGSSHDIYAQRFDETGSAVGGEFLVNSTTSGEQFEPSIAMDNFGGFVVTWTGHDGSSYGIFGQRFDSSGTALGSEFHVNTYSHLHQRLSSVDVDSLGGFVVTWRSDPQDGDGWGVFAQRFNADGTRNGSEFQVNTTTASNQHNPTVGVDAAGNFLVAWSSRFQDGDGWGIFGQRYDSSGAAIGGEFQINTTTVSDQISPSLDFDSAGNFVVAWESSNQDGSSTGVFAQRFAADGSSEGSEFRVNAYTPNTQNGASVAMHSTGEFVIVWNSQSQDGSSSGVFGQRFDRFGNPVGIEFQINSYTTSDQSGPSVAVGLSGSFVVTWNSRGQDGDDWGVFAQRFRGGLDGSGGPTVVDVKVHNVTPTIILDPVADIDENGVATLTGTITDPGTLDTFTLDIDWGDSLSPDNVEQYTFAASTTGSQTFTLYHQYLDDNPSATSSDTYTISATVTDDDQSTQGLLFEYDEVNPGASGTALGSIPANEVTLASAGNIDSLTMALSDNTAGNVQLTALIYVGDGNPNTPPGTLLGTSQVITDIANTKTDVTFDFGGLAVPQNIVVGFTSSDGLVVYHGFPAQGDVPTVGSWVKSWNGINGNFPSDSPKVFDMTIGTSPVTVQTTVTVDNVAPTLVLDTVATIDEHGVATLTGTINDPGTLDTFTLDIDWGDSLSPDNVEQYTFASSTTGSQTFTLYHQYLDDNPSATSSDTYTISATVTDDDSGTGSTTQTVTVDNVAPTLVLDTVATIDEHGVATLTGTINDPGTLDTFTLDIDWGDSLSPDNVEQYTFAASTTGSQTFTLYHQYLDDNPSATSSDTYTISATVTDDDSGTGSTTQTVTVNNVAPTLVLDPVVDIDENGVATLTGTITDPGTLDTFTLDIDWGDALSPSNVEQYLFSASTTGTQSFTLTHQYLDDNPTSTGSDVYTISATVTDDDTGSDSATQTVTVDNVAPEVLTLDVGTTFENVSVTVSGTYGDVGTLDTHELTIEWGDGNVELQTVSGGSFSFSHQYLDDNPTGTASDDYTISVTLTDDDTGSATDAVVTTITNVAPAITAITSGAEECGDAHEDDPITLNLDFTDAGTLDEHTVSIDWGDGTSEVVVLPVGERSLEIEHDYSTGGVFEIQVSVSDDDLGVDAASVLAVVSGVGLKDGVLQIIGTSADDHVTINQTGNGRLKVHADFILENLTDDTRDFVLADVERILMILCDGDDHATISNKVTLPTIIDGGAGNDHLNGGGGSNLIRGGAGDDHLNGGSGRDVLIGGLGADRIVANSNSDFLTGGTLRTDDSEIAGTIGEEANLIMLQNKFTDADSDDIALWVDDVDDFFSDLALSLGDDDGEEDHLTGSSGEDVFALFDGDVVSGSNGNGKGKGKKK